MTAVAMKVEDFQYDPGLILDEGHRYFYNHVPIPGATEIMQDLNILDFSQVPKDQLIFAQTRGTFVHKAIELWIQGRLDENTVDHNIKPHLESFKLLYNTRTMKCVHLEKIRVNQDMAYATKPDAIGYYNGDAAVFDWKTGLVSPTGLAIRVQLKLGELTCPVPLRRFGVKTRGDGKIAQLHEYTDEQDEFLARSIVSIFHAKRG